MAGTSQPRTPIVQASEEVRAVYEDGKVLLIDKPVHWTSFDIIKKVRNSLRIKKVGHAGTLDPLASGLLIICTGKFTKKINEYMAKEKEYTGSFTLGAVTPTYDLESDPEQHKDTGSITEEMIRNAVVPFIGDIQQYPPIYSAIKKEGTALYQLARRGEDIDLQPRNIRIDAFEITAINMPVVEFRILCSTGTYIRSVAHDFGKSLGCGAYLSALRRTAIGEFKVQDAMSLDEFLQTLGSTVIKTGNAESKTDNLSPQ